jgi:hypothetical protein
MARGFIPPLANGEGRLARGFLVSVARSDSAARSYPPPTTPRQIQSIRRRNATATPPATIDPIVMA